MGLPNTTGHLHSIAARQPESKQTRYKHHKGQKQTNIESLFHHHESFLSSQDRGEFYSQSCQDQGIMDLLTGVQLCNKAGQ